MRTLFVTGRKASGKSTTALSSCVTLIAIQSKRCDGPKPTMLCVGLNAHQARVIESRMLALSELVGITGYDSERGHYSIKSVACNDLVDLESNVDFIVVDGPDWQKIAPWARANSSRIGTIISTSPERA